MTTRIVETSDGGFTLQGLTEVSRNVFSVGGGGGGLLHGFGVFVSADVPDAPPNDPVPFDTVAYDTDGFYVVQDAAVTIPVGLAGLYLFQLELYVGESAGLSEVRMYLHNTDPTPISGYDAPMPHAPAPANFVGNASFLVETLEGSQLYPTMSTETAAHAVTILGDADGAFSYMQAVRLGTLA